MTATVARRRVHLPDLTALALLALTVGVGVAFHSRLPAEMVVGWHLGLDGEVSLTHGPRTLGTFAVPAVAVGLYAVVRGVAAIPAVREDLRETGARRAYDAALHGLLALCCVAEVALVAANLS